MYLGNLPSICITIILVRMITNIALGTVIEKKNDRCTRMEKLCLSLQTKRISQTLINNPLIGIVNRNRSILLNNKCDCQLTAIKLTGIKTGLILLSREDSIDSALLHHFGFAFRTCLIFAFLAIAKSLKPTSDGRRQCNKRGIFDDERRLGIIDAGIAFPIRRGIANTFNVNLLVGYFCVGPDFFTHTPIVFFIVLILHCFLV